MPHSEPNAISCFEEVKFFDCDHNIKNVHTCTFDESCAVCNISAGSSVHPSATNFSMDKLERAETRSRTRTKKDSSLSKRMEDSCISLEEQKSKRVKLEDSHPLSHRKCVGDDRSNSYDCSSDDEDPTFAIVNHLKHKRSADNLKHRSYKKPKRPCPYCDLRTVKLSRHILSQHKEETEVQYILSLNKKERTFQLEKLRKKSIFNENIEKIRNSEQITMVRKQKEKNSSLICSGCLGFYSNKTIYKHKRNCQKLNERKLTTINKEKLIFNSDEDISSLLSDKFKALLFRFKKTEVGDICRSEDLLKLIGYRYFQMNSNAAECMACMRILARILINLRKEVKETVSMFEIYKSDNFPILEKVVQNICVRESGRELSALKLRIGNTLIFSVKVLMPYFAITNNNDQSAELNKFYDLLRMHWGYMFLPALKNRQQNLKKSQEPGENADQCSPAPLEVCKVRRLLDAVDQNMQSVATTNKISNVPLDITGKDQEATRNDTCVKVEAVVERENIDSLNKDSEGDVSKRGRNTYIQWRKEDEDELFGFFKKQIAQLKCPSKAEIERYIALNFKKTYSRIRDKLNNEIRRRKKK